MTVLRHTPRLTTKNDDLRTIIEKGEYTLKFDFSFFYMFKKFSAFGWKNKNILSTLIGRELPENLAFFRRASRSLIGGWNLGLTQPVWQLWDVGDWIITLEKSPTQRKRHQYGFVNNILKLSPS